MGEPTTCPACGVPLTEPYPAHRRWRCPEVTNRTDIRDVAVANGLPRDAALWLVLDAVVQNATAQLASDAAHREGELKREVVKARNEAIEARADLAARIEERVNAAEGVTINVDNDYIRVEADFGRKEFIVPPHTVTVTLTKDANGALMKDAVLAIVRKEATR